MSNIQEVNLSLVEQMKPYTELIKLAYDTLYARIGIPDEIENKSLPLSPKSVQDLNTKN